jgi:prephenate dehydratase
MLATDPKGAAISSLICAELYNTGIIAENIQDAKGGSRVIKFVLTFIREHNPVLHIISTVITLL